MPEIKSPFHAKEKLSREIQNELFCRQIEVELSLINQRKS
jgi:hypothetical protein